jgi:hypothetical protein
MNLGSKFRNRRNTWTDVSRQLPRPLQEPHMGHQDRQTRERRATDAKSEGANDRFRAIVEAVDPAGFNTFDDMATEYYTSQLDHMSPLGTTQNCSRERHLKNFLMALNQSSKGWSERETWAYQESISETAQRSATRS